MTCASHIPRLLLQRCGIFVFVLGRLTENILNCNLISRNRRCPCPLSFNGSLAYRQN
jgi:hypothetical protein